MLKPSFLLKLLVLVAFPLSLKAAPPTYAMKCRGGGNLSFNLSVDGYLRFGFVRGATAAGPSGNSLYPGQCAWVDRAVNANEPDLIRIATNANFKVGVMMPHKLNNTFKAYLYAQNQPWLGDFQTNDTILTIYVYNDGNGSFVAPNP